MTHAMEWQRLVGSWATRATHRLLPGAVAAGESVFEWLPDQQFLVQRSHNDHPDIPDALAVMGMLDGTPTMHYFDPRGVHRVFHVELTDATWRFWNDTPGFAQRFTGTFSADGDSIDGAVELCRDGATWESDLAVTYRRLG
jgi:hypothetical protein